jgi:hypothetical protein
MSAKRVLYFTSSEHYVYRWSRRALELDARFEADEEGLAEFRDFLRHQKGALFYVVADLAGEDFHEDQIPYLRGGDRQAVVQRRLAQRYRDTRLAAALPLGYITGERRNERLLLTSFTNTEQFTPWLDALVDSDTKLAGVYSIPLIAPAVASRLGTRGGRAFLITHNRVGLRQSYIDNGRLRFSRLERTGNMPPESLAAFVRSEMMRLAQYLGGLRALPRDGPPVQVLVVAPPGQRGVFEQALVSDARLTFRALDADDAARAVGVRRASGTFTEQLYLHLVVTKPPKQQFARREERRGFRIWQLQRGIAFAGVIGFTACALYAGANWLDVMSLRNRTESEQRQARAATEQYERITAAFPVTQTTTDNLKATVVEFREIAAHSSTPDASFIHLSKVLEDFPQIELDRLTWRVGLPVENEREAPPAAVAAKTGSATAQTAELLEIGGRVNATQRSDYRGITAQVQRLAAALSAGSSYRVLRTQLPFDITSQGTLTGDIGATEAGEAPRFTIVLVRTLK